MTLSYGFASTPLGKEVVALKVITNTLSGFDFLSLFEEESLLFLLTSALLKKDPMR